MVVIHRVSKSPKAGKDHEHSDDRDITALLVIDPYNDFISEGGKVWDRGTPERAGRGTLRCMETEPGSVRTYVRFKYGDADGEVLYEYQVGPVGYIPTEGETVTLPVGYDEQSFKQYLVTRRHFFYSGWQDNISTQHINIIVADA